MFGGRSQGARLSGAGSGGSDYYALFGLYEAFPVWASLRWLETPLVNWLM